MEFKKTVLCVLLLYFAFAEGGTDLHYDEPEIRGHEGGDITIVCESDLERQGARDDEVRRKISWLRGGPPVEDLEVVASSDGRVSIDVEIVSETTNGEMKVNSTLTIHGAVVDDSTNYTCCKRDTPMCYQWETRKQRQLQLIILPAQTPTEQRKFTTTTPSQEWITYSSVEPSTISTALTNEIRDHSVLPNVNEAFHQKRKIYIIAVPLILAVVLVIVVFFIARHYWRKISVDTPVQDFDA